MIIPYTDLPQIRATNPGKKIVFSDGTFDLFHVGHVEHLKNLRRYGEVVVVGVMSDAWVRLRKGSSRPVMGEEERLALVDSVRYVDYATLLTDMQKKERVRTTEALSLLRPDIFVTADTTWNAQDELLKNFGVELAVVERVPPDMKKTLEDVSTSRIIERIQDLRG